MGTKISRFSVSRKTLKEAGLTKEQIAFFTDEKMTALTSMIFFESMHFLEDVHIVATGMLEESFGKAYCVTAITRTSLKEAGITDAEIATLTDDDIETIAAKVSACIDGDELLHHIMTSARAILDFGNTAV